MALQQSDAGIPAKNGLVISRWALRLSLLVPAHRLLEPVIRPFPGPGHARPELHFGASLADDAGVVGSLVLILESRQHLLRPTNALRWCRPELIGDGQDERHQRLLVIRAQGQNIETDALRRAGIVDDPVALGFLQG